jgi:voltage-gated sodium channel
MFETIRLKFKTVADSPWFQNFVTAVILAAGVVVGFETYSEFAEKHHGILGLLNNIVLWIFVAEIVVKMGQHGITRFYRYFFDPWNVFDFLIVAVCFMPIDAQYVTVLRLARLLRVLKLVRALPRLQILVGALLKSIPSMVYVSVLLGLLFYLYGVAGTFLFSENDPVHFRNLQMSMLSLFRACTLEDWTDLMYINMYGSANYGYDAAMLAELQPVSRAMPVFGAAYFVSFVMMGTMIILNLFIGVIMNGMEEAQKESEEAARVAERGGGAPTLQDELADLQKQLEEMQSQVERVQKVARKTAA